MAIEPDAAHRRQRRMDSANELFDYGAQRAINEQDFMKIERHRSSTESVVEITRVIYEDELDSVTGAGGGYNGIVMDDTAGKEGIRIKSVFIKVTLV